MGWLLGTQYKQGKVKFMTVLPKVDNRFQYYILISIGFYRLNDCLTKLLTQDFGTFEILFYRSLFTLMLMPVFLYYAKVNFKMFFDKTIMLRNVLAAVALFLEVASLEYLPLTTFMLLLYSVPIFMKIFARIFLKETISTLEIGVIIISLIGTLFVFDFTCENGPIIGVIYALLGAMTYALSCVVTKKVKDQDSNSIYFSYVVVLFLMSLLKFPETVPAIQGMAILFSMAVIHIAAFLLYLKGFFMLKTSRTAVLEYSGLIFALIFDYALWNKLPVSHEILGASLILSASLASIYRESIFEFFKKIHVSWGNHTSSSMPNSNK